MSQYLYLDGVLALLSQPREKFIPSSNNSCGSAWSGRQCQTYTE